jgi:signal transduction histidine kinase
MLPNNKKKTNKLLIRYFSFGVIGLVFILQLYSLTFFYDYITDILSNSYNEALQIAIKKNRAHRMHQIKSTINVRITPENPNTKNNIDDTVYNLNSKIIAGIPFNIKHIDSICTSILKEKDIITAYNMVIYAHDKDSIIAQSSNKTISTNRCTERKEIDWKHDVQIFYKNPAQFILKRMIAYVSISLSIIIITILSFIYQLKIIRKQRNIEEVRQNFVDSMTHELRHPLQGALSLTEILNNKSFAENKALRDDAILKIKHNIESVSLLLESIVQRSYSDQLQHTAEWKEGNLVDIINKLIASFNITTTKTVNFTTYFSDDSCRHWFDQVHLPNAIKNLIDNAIKYSGEEVNIFIELFSNDTELIIKVSDDGDGIKEEELTHIFDKFYKVHHKHKIYGLGLGLSYVKWVCQIHDGSIEVESTVGQGSNFTITIPRFK